MIPSMKIYKYALPNPSKSVQFMELPRGARMLSVHVQDRGIYLWAMVDPEATTVARRIAIVGTGWDLPPRVETEGKFVGTVLLPVGPGLVFHLFDCGEVL